MQITDNLDSMINAKPIKPFDERVIEFLNCLSKRLINAREYPDVATFGFWCRKSALLKEKAKYDDAETRLGRGIIFHSTPSNVPVNFAFSFAAGLLAGNANIVRLPGRDFEQVKIIVTAVNELIDSEYKDLAPYINFVKYPPNKEMHDIYSSVCDVRIVWGGDNTVRELRQSPLKPKATEITFADRYSIAVINADEYLKTENKAAVTQAFYNDTYLSDQNACTSPMIVFWTGRGKEHAKKVFWENIRGAAAQKYALTPIQAVSKLAAFCKASVKLPVSLIDGWDSYTARVGLAAIAEGLMTYRSNSGFFFEYDIEELAEILPVCEERLQTLIYYGLTKDEIKEFILRYKPKGIDRVVPMGSSMNFTLTWDGYDLIRCLSKRIVIS